MVFKWKPSHSIPSYISISYKKALHDSNHSKKKENIFIISRSSRLLAKFGIKRLSRLLLLIYLFTYIQILQITIEIAHASSGSVKEVEGNLQKLAIATGAPDWTGIESF